MNYSIYILLIIILLFMLGLAYAIYALKYANNNNYGYNKILNHLYLGNINAARNINFIKNHNIKYIFNISNEIPNYFNTLDNIQYINLHVSDDLAEQSIHKMYTNLYKLVLSLDKYISLNNGNILVHCYAGRQRSAVLIAAYLMYKKNMTPKEAYRYIIAKRPEAFHYGQFYNFNDALEKYYIDLQNNGIV